MSIFSSVGRGKVSLSSSCFVRPLIASVLNCTCVLTYQFNFYCLWWHVPWNLVWCILPALLQELKHLDLSNNEFKKITLPESKFLFEEMFMLGKTRILFEWKCWLAHLWNKKTPSPFSRVIGQYVPYALHWSMCLCMWLYASSYVRLCIHAHTDTHLRFPAQT